MADGPREVTITRLLCDRCSFLVAHENRGRVEAVGRDHYCSHPDADDDQPMLSGLYGRFIGTTARTPGWCPFLREKGGNPDG